MTISQIHKKLSNKEISCRELTKKFLNTIEEKDDDVHAFLEMDEKGALKKADDIDAKIAKGEKLSSIEGVPTAVKDNILLDGLKCTAGSKILENYSAPYDATVIRKLRDAGTIFIGKTNLDEFAMGSSTENSAFGPTRNPHDFTRVPGGSSGGSAAAVAADMCSVALGSDTAGSIRQPAAFCGVVGFKPTYGAVSRYGLISMACSFDQIGVFGNNVEDVRTIFDVIRGKDSLDATSFDIKIPAPKDRSSPSIDGRQNLNIGIPKEYFTDGIDTEVKESIEDAIKKYEKNGAKITEISLSHTEYVLPVYYIITPAEISSNLARYDGIRYGMSNDKCPAPGGRGSPSETGRQISNVKSDLLKTYLCTRMKGFGDEVRRRIMLGTHTLSSGYYDAYYIRAQKVRALIKQDFDKAFSKIDVIMTPTTPTFPFKLGEKIEDPVAMYLSDVFTAGVNLAGLPSAVIPCDWRDVEGKKLPVGLQIIGRQREDYKVLDVAEMYEGFK